MGNGPYKESGVWYHGDGSAYRNQALAESDVEFRTDSEKLRVAYAGENEVHPMQGHTMPEHTLHGAGRESATIQVGRG